MGEISEICGLLYKLVLEMKSMNESMIERMDKLELIFWKILKYNRNKGV